MSKPFTITTSPSPTSNGLPASPLASPIWTHCADGDVPHLTFAPLAALPFVRHAFTLRPTAAADGPASRPSKAGHHGLLRALGTNPKRLATAQQVHGAGVVVVNQPPACPVPDTDGLLTTVAGLPLGVHVADCCAVYLVDRRTPAIGLLHSGRRGTLQNIAGRAIASLRQAFGSDPADVLAVLGPCIGPCHYEMDIPAQIEGQLRAVGVRDIFPSGLCTACHVDWFYSYRADRGQCGRMLAVLMLTDVQRNRSE